MPDALWHRILRWSLRIALYDYTTEYLEVKYNINANVLNRLPLPETENAVSNPSQIMFVSTNNDWPVTSTTITIWMTENPVTKEILEWVLYEYPRKIESEEYQPY